MKEKDACRWKFITLMIHREENGSKGALVNLYSGQGTFLSKKFFETMFGVDIPPLPMVVKLKVEISLEKEAPVLCTLCNRERENCDLIELEDKNIIVCDECVLGITEDLRGMEDEFAKR